MLWDISFCGLHHFLWGWDGVGRVSSFANVCLKIDFMSVDIYFSRELAARTGPEVVDIPRMSH